MLYTACHKRRIEAVLYRACRERRIAAVLYSACYKMQSKPDGERVRVGVTGDASFSTPGICYLDIFITQFGFIQVKHK